MSTSCLASSVVLQRPSSSGAGTRQPSLPRPTLPSLASWTPAGSVTSAPVTAPQPNPPQSAGSTSSFEADEAITPFDGPTFPAPPSSLKMPSPRVDANTSNGTTDLNRETFRVQAIPAFRGSRTPTEHPPSAPITRPASTAPRPDLVNPASRPDINSRRASFASVFSLPRQNPPPAPPPPAPEPVSMGLGIAGCGVGGAKDALIIERLGETMENGRRGSLKRVLVSEDEEDRDSQRSSKGSKDGERSHQNGESHPQQTYSLPRRGSSSLAPPQPVQRRTGSSSPPQAGTLSGRSSPSAPKRPRTAQRSPLDSLVAAAAGLARPASAASAVSSSSTTIPELANLLSGPVPTNAQQAAQLETARAMREQELERRRQAAAANPPPGSVGAALGKLRAEQQSLENSEAPSSGRSKSGLGKRRGHRPPAVNTSPSSSASSSNRPHPYHLSAGNDTLPPLRSAPVEIPSVLVGSPVDPHFAARAARELPPLRSAAVQPPAGPHRRQSRSGAADRGESASSYPPPPHAQPPLVSNSTHYVRPNSVAYPPAATPSSAKQQQHPPPSAGHRVPSYGSERRAPSPGAAYHPLQPAPPHQHQYVSHPSSHHSQQQQHYPPPSAGSGRPVSPGGPVHTAPPHPISHPHSAAASHHPHHHPHPSDRGRLSPAFLPATAPLPSTNASSSSSSSGASKTAFLSLFSTFYDSLSDSRVLTSNLEGQIQRASSLLATLQNAEGVIERLVEDKVARAMGERDGRLKSVEERLRKIEERVLSGGGASSASSMAFDPASSLSSHREREREQQQYGERRGSGESNDTALTSASLVEDRLDRIEKVLQGAVASSAGGELVPSALSSSSTNARPSALSRNGGSGDLRPESIMEESPSIVQQGDEKMRE